MDPVWRSLPDHLALRIIEFLDEIDVRLFFRISPRKLTVPKNLQFRNEIVYDHLSRTMWDFSGMSDPDHPYWIMRKGIKFSQFRSPNLYVFNIGWEDYDMTMYSDTHQIGPTVCRNHIILDKNVKFK
jgi:hypothetical protein